MGDTTTRNRDSGDEKLAWQAGNGSRFRVGYAARSDRRLEDGELQGEWEEGAGTKEAKLPGRWKHCKHLIEMIEEGHRDALNIIL